MKRNIVLIRKESRVIPWLFSLSWEQREVGDLIEDYVERTVVQNQYPVLTSSQQQGVVLQEDYFADRQVTTNDNIGYFVLPRGYFTYRSRSDTDLFVFNRNNIIDRGIISYYYPVFSPKDCDSDFLLRRLNHGIKHQLSMAAEGTGQRVLAHSKFKKMVLSIPDISEQKEIGHLFEVLDTLITLHQRQGNQSIYEPSQMFQETTSAWEQRKFGEAFDLLTNNTLSRAELNDETGSVLNVHYGDILVKYGEIIDTETDHLPYISDATKVVRPAFLMDGDVIIADTAEDNTVGKCAEIIGIADKTVVSGLHTIPCRPRSQFAQGYLGYFMNSPAFHDQLLPLMQGTKVTSVSKSALQDTVISFPSERAEQGQIGRYFMALDTLITLHQRKPKSRKGGSHVLYSYQV